MPLPSIAETIYLSLCDLLAAHIRQPMPPTEKLKRCKIISHRGEHDNSTVKENTLAAFEGAAAAGVWGLEMDVRWTRDLVPVVAHDADLHRVFGITDHISQMTWNQMHGKVPMVPRLADVVARFGQRQHLMIEVKDNDWPDPSGQALALKEALSPLTAIDDYHLMSLKPESLSRLKSFPANVLVAIANTWPDSHSRWVLDHRWGGICTHFSVLRRTLIKRHKRAKQKVGVGYPASPNSLSRELNRNVDWIFSNNAAELQAMLKKMMTAAQ